MSNRLDKVVALADEVEALPTDTAIRFAPEAQRVIVAALRAIEKVDEMVAVLGHHGTISARDDRVLAVMDCLHEIDPK